MLIILAKCTCVALNFLHRKELMPSRPGAEKLGFPLVICEYHLLIKSSHASSRGDARYLVFFIKHETFDSYFIHQRFYMQADSSSLVRRYGVTFYGRVGRSLLKKDGSNGRRCGVAVFAFTRTSDQDVAIPEITINYVRSEVSASKPMKAALSVK
ncbi:hypothetical protein Trydic_g3074 [Trypoxylus dichotomus]